MSLVRGWCPGALTPMETGDGLLVRVRPRAGRFSLDQVRAVAAASCFGNGEIDLTNRANLQLRGLTREGVPEAIAVLGAAGLIDPSGEVEAIRNVMVAPLANEGAFGLAAELEDGLAGEVASLAGLPGKFGFGVECETARLPPDARVDVRLTVCGARVVIGVAGTGEACVEVARGEGVAAALALARAFLDLREGDKTLRRMADVVARVGAEAVYGSAGLEMRPGTPPRASQCSEGQGTHPLDPLPVGVIGSAWRSGAVGIGLPFGRISWGQLASLVEAAERAGVSEVRPSSRRCLVMPLVGSGDGRGLMDVARQLGLIVSGDDVRLAMDVCPGSPACGRATTRTRDDAEAIVAALRAERGAERLGSIHVSGCVKGCARAGLAEITLVAREGRYDLIRGGRSGDTAQAGGFSAAALPELVVQTLRGARG